MGPNSAQTNSSELSQPLPIPSHSLDTSASASSFSVLSSSVADSSSTTTSAASTRVVSATQQAVASTYAPPSIPTLPSNTNSSSGSESVSHSTSSSDNSASVATPFQSTSSSISITNSTSFFSSASSSSGDPGSVSALASHSSNALSYKALPVASSIPTDHTIPAKGGHVVMPLESPKITVDQNVILNAVRPGDTDGYCFTLCMLWTLARAYPKKYGWVLGAILDAVKGIIAPKNLEKLHDLMIEIEDVLQDIYRQKVLEILSDGHLNRQDSIAVSCTKEQLINLLEELLSMDGIETIILFSLRPYPHYVAFRREADSDSIYDPDTEEITIQSKSKTGVELATKLFSAFHFTSPSRPYSIGITFFGANKNITHISPSKLEQRLQFYRQQNMVVSPRLQQCLDFETAEMAAAIDCVTTLKFYLQVNKPFLNLVLIDRARKTEVSLIDTAVQFDSRNALLALLDNGARVDLAIYGHYTPLQEALQWQHYDNAEVLLAHGAMPSKLSNDTSVLTFVMKNATRKELLDRGFREEEIQEEFQKTVPQLESIRNAARLSQQIIKGFWKTDFTTKGGSFYTDERLEEALGLAIQDRSAALTKDQLLEQRFSEENISHALLRIQKSITTPIEGLSSRGFNVESLTPSSLASHSLFASASNFGMLSSSVAGSSSSTTSTASTRVVSATQQATQVTHNTPALPSNTNSSGSS